MEEETAAVATKDVLEALMEYLVEPFLPSKFTPHDPLPHITLQESTAKQMHAVVLLYNYYHRLQYSQLEFLDFESFCKVALSVKPGLLIYLKRMRECNSDGQVKDLSITEKAIVDACNISIGLDTVKDAQSMEGWPVSKVAVFLTDSMMQKCFLKFSSSTEGVWSLIEKNGGLLGPKKKIKKGKADETLRQLAMSAVKETAGIDPAELTILESHVTYSLSKEKTLARLYIMKCASVEENKFEVTMKDAIDSLQGPLVKKNGNSYLFADIVEFFHLLPYARMIRDCFSRKLVSNGLTHLREGNTNRNSPQGNDEPVTVAAVKRSKRSSTTCQSSDVLILKTNNTESSESDLKSTKGGPLVKKDKVASRRRACNNEMDMDGQKGKNEVRVKISTPKTDLVEQRKRQRVCFQNGSSKVDADIGNSDTMRKGLTILPEQSMVNNDGTVYTDLRMDSVTCTLNSEYDEVHIGLQDKSIVDRTSNSQEVNTMEDAAIKKDESQLQLIPHSIPDDIIWVGSVCFPSKYNDLYQCIVGKFGDIIIPMSKQITLCSELVSATMKSFFEVVDSMVHASPATVDTEVLESWELKLKFCELSGLKIGWLHDHLEQVRQAFNSGDNGDVRELETRAGALAEALEGKRKHGDELAKMLEKVRAEEKALLEERILVDADLEAARARQKCFSLSL